MKPAIRVHNISKQYRLGVARTKDNNLTETLRTQVKSARDKIRRLVTPNAAPDDLESFWALKDVSFEVQPGEVVGIIGRNGAGKSTLLKILSQIVEPTSGYAEVRGRMGSLLEVGTGFHPELTGRENIYLNGAILGMRREEITRKFDEIVAFAEVEKFLDTPVKRYSSGMYVRLAFAVAAHLEPEILVVDEVLAVGDAVFQKKCFDKMNNIASNGRTILIVSHNTSAVRNLCRTSVLLRNGAVFIAGSTNDVLACYNKVELPCSTGEYDLSHYRRNIGHKKIIMSCTILSPELRPTSYIPSGGPVVFQLIIDLDQPAISPQLGIGIDDVWGNRIFSVGTFITECDLPSLPAGKSSITCRIPEMPLTPGHYRANLSFGRSLIKLDDQIEDAVTFQIVDSDFFGNGRIPTEDLGRVLIRSTWMVGKSEMVIT